MGWTPLMASMCQDRRCQNRYEGASMEQVSIIGVDLATEVDTAVGQRLGADRETPHGPCRG
jgi:hypothetical protein